MYSLKGSLEGVDETVGHLAQPAQIVAEVVDARAQREGLARWVALGGVHDHVTQLPVHRLGVERPVARELPFEPDDDLVLVVGVEIDLADDSLIGQLELATRPRALEGQRVALAEEVAAGDAERDVGCRAVQPPIGGVPAGPALHQPAIGELLVELGVVATDVQAAEHLAVALDVIAHREARLDGGGVDHLAAGIVQVLLLRGA